MRKQRSPSSVRPNRAAVSAGRRLVRVRVRDGVRVRAMVRVRVRIRVRLAAG